MHISLKYLVYFHYNFTEAHSHSVLYYVIKGLFDFLKTTGFYDAFDRMDVATIMIKTVKIAVTAKYKERKIIVSSRTKTIQSGELELGILIAAQSRSQSISGGHGTNPRTGMLWERD